MNLPSAVLFDHDGVLVASEPLHWGAWRKMIEELGLPYYEADIQSRIGKTAPEILSTYFDLHVPGWNSKEYDIAALCQRKNDHYLVAVKTELRAYPGVEDGLKWLRSQGIKTAVVSNAKRRELVTALDTVALTSYFDTIVARDDVGAYKPDPTPYLFAVGVLLVETSQCVAVEDSPTGLESALLAKIPTAAVLTNFQKNEVAQPVPGRPDLKPVWIGPSMKDFFSWLQTLKSGSAIT